MNKDLKSRANPNCTYCLGQGVRHNGYFSYACNCTVGDPILDYIRDVHSNTTPKKVFNLPITHHKGFGSLDNDTLTLYLDFLAEALRKIDAFTVWEAENCHSEGDDTKWDEVAIEVFSDLLSLRDELDDRKYRLDEKENR